MKFSSTTVRNTSLATLLVFSILVTVCFYFIQSQICAGKDWSVSLGNADMTFKFVKEGRFEMGCMDELFMELDARPYFETVEQYFWMSSTEVTVAQYREFVESKNWQGTEENPTDGICIWNDGQFVVDKDLSWDSVYSDNDRNPVVGVSWYDAVEFCLWLTDRERSSGKLRKDFEYKLPTEIQWEYACKAMDSQTEMRGTFDNGWSSENSAKRSHPAGTKRPNSWGIYDMHGNVWEWCFDSYAPYPNGQETSKWSTQAPGSKVIRGGSWYNTSVFTHASYRDASSPEKRVFDIGFRVLCQPVGPRSLTFWEKIYQVYIGSVDLVKMFLIG